MKIPSKALPLLVRIASKQNLEIFFRSEDRALQSYTYFYHFFRIFAHLWRHQVTMTIVYWATFYTSFSVGYFHTKF